MSDRSIPRQDGQLSNWIIWLATAIMKKWMTTTNHNDYGMSPGYILEFKRCKSGQLSFTFHQGMAGVLLAMSSITPACKVTENVPLRLLKVSSTRH